MTGSVGRTIDRINKDLPAPSYMLYTLTTISVWFTDIHSNCQAPNPLHTHTHDSYLLLWHMCAGVCECVRVCVGCAVEDMHTSVGRTVYPVYKLQQHVSTHSRKGSWGRERLKRPLYNYFRLLQTNPASKTAAAVAAMAAMATTMARTMTGRRRVYAILALAYY